MVEQQQDNSWQFILSDLGTRIRDLEERSSSIRERMFLIGQNLLDTKEEIQTKILEIEKENSEIISEMKKMRKNVESLSSDLNKFVKKEEIILVERMLKDFQPLEFLRRKDFEEEISQIKKELINLKQVNIKSSKDKI